MVKKLNLSGEKVYMKKDWLGWRQIYPIKKDDGSWNYPNLLFGGYRNLIFLVLILLAIVLVVSAYKHDTASCTELFQPDNLRERVCTMCSQFNENSFGDIVWEHIEYDGYDE